MRLQHRLSATMAMLLVVGLLVADVATYASLRSFLLGRVDEQLAVAQRVAYNTLVRFSTFGGPLSNGFRRPPTSRTYSALLSSRVSPDVYVLVLAKDGRTLVNLPSGSDTNPDPRPALASPLRTERGLRPRTFGRHQGTYRPSPDSFETPAIGGRSARYRVEAVAVPQGTLITAISLNPTTDTLGSLLKVELAASAAVVVTLLVVGLWTVRRGLRPLEEMAKTAGAIASGELGRRVTEGNPRSEVGRLGGSLNAMLARIEAAFEAKSVSESRLRQFVADASHELRTPLTTIRGYAELLGKDRFPDEQSSRRALSRVEQEAARMGGLVDDLLLLARLDQGRPLRSEDVDLALIARNAVEDAKAVDPDRPIRFNVRQPVTVAGDPDRLGQVANNLVRNALNHTPAGTPIRVEADVEGSMGVLRVVDTGPGLVPGQAATVFDRFSRGDVARSRGGTGLGLAIVRAIAEALHGNASVTSEPGQGATFTVCIPLAASGPGIQGSPPQLVQPSPGAAPRADSVASKGPPVSA